MKKDFDDIFESIKQLHKKYSSKEYLKNIDIFNENAKELGQILEKYKKEDISKNKRRNHQDKYINGVLFL